MSECVPVPLPQLLDSRMHVLPPPPAALTAVEGVAEKRLPLLLLAFVMMQSEAQECSPHALLPMPLHCLFPLVRIEDGRFFSQHCKSCKCLTHAHLVPGAYERHGGEHGQGLPPLPHEPLLHTERLAGKERADERL